MRISRMLVATLATTTVLLGAAACSSDSDSSASSPSSSASAASAEATEATDDSSAGTGEPTADGPGSEFCVVAEKTFTEFDAGSLAAADPEALSSAAGAFRSVGDASSEPDVAAAWSQYADLLELSGAIVTDPGDTASISKLNELVSTQAEAQSTIQASILGCAG